MSGISSLANNTQAASRQASLPPASAAKAARTPGVPSAGQSQHRLPDASEYSFNKIPKESLSRMEYYRPRTQQAPSLAGTALAAARASADVQGTQAAEWAAKGGGIAAAAAKADGASPETAKPYTGCETCQQRQYKDDSNDAGVSFQGATHIPSSTAAIRVASHEGEHVTRETDKAGREGRTVTNKTVTLQFACCPECRKMYVAGGVTSITTMPDMSGTIDTGTALETDPAGENVDEEL